MTWLVDVCQLSLCAAALPINYHMQGSSRQVETADGQDFARKHGCLFVETSAKTNFAVQTAFDELVSKILETPALLDQVLGAKLQASKDKPSSSLCCS